MVGRSSSRTSRRIGLPSPSPAPWTPSCAACVTRSSWIRAGTLWRGWSGQLTWLLPDLLTPYGIWQLEVSPDLQQAIFLTKQANRQGAFYCDGQQVVDLAVACGIAEDASLMLTARWLGADILVIATDDGSQESRLTDVYGYDCATELARPTVSRAAAYIPQRQEDGLQFYAGAAYATYRQNGTLWVTNLRTGETHDTGVSADAPYHICTVGEDIAVVQEQ